MYTETVMFFGLAWRAARRFRGRDYKWDIFQDRLRLVIALKAHTWYVAGGGIAGKHLDYARTQERFFVWFNQKKNSSEVPPWRGSHGLESVAASERDLCCYRLAPTSRRFSKCPVQEQAESRSRSHTHHNKLHIGNVYYSPSPKSPARQTHTHRRTHTSKIFSSFRRTPKEKFAVAWEAAGNTPATSHPVFQRLNNTSRTPLYADGGARRRKTIRAEDTFSCENKSKGGPAFKMSVSVIDFFFPQQVLSADLDSGWRIWGRRTKRRRQPCVAKQSRRGRRSLAPAYQAPRPTVWTRGFCCHRADGRARATRADFLLLGRFGR